MMCLTWKRAPSPMVSYDPQGRATLAGSATQSRSSALSWSTSVFDLRDAVQRRDEDRVTYRDDGHAIESEGGNHAWPSDRRSELRVSTATTSPSGGIIVRPWG